MGIVVDSGVFIRWERDGRLLDFSAWDSNGLPFISVVTVSELNVGVHRAYSPSRRQKRAAFVSLIRSCVPVLDIDASIAEIHARIVAELFTCGTTIGPHDSWIAATALKHDYELLTTNAGEFTRVPRACE